MKTLAIAALLLSATAAQSLLAQDRSRGETERGSEEVYSGKDNRGQSRGQTERAEDRERGETGRRESRRDRRDEDWPRDDRRDEDWPRDDRRDEDWPREDRRPEDRRRDQRRPPSGVLGDIFGTYRSEIPPGHYPPPGECRVWYPDRPAGHQPPPEPCYNLRSRRLGGAFILYGDDAYDVRDERAIDRARSRSVPEIIVDIL